MDEDYVLVVSRAVAACSRCKQAKTKCDGNLPACGACVKAGKSDQCSSRKDDEFARGRERSWVATLEVREQKLQQKINEARRRRGLPPVQNFPRSSFGSQQSPPASPPPEARPVSSDTRRHERTDIDQLVANFGVLSVNAASRDFQGFTDTMSYARMILAASTKDPVPNGLKCSLPPYSDAKAIANQYTQGISRFLPIFEETTFWAAMAAVYHPSGTVASAMQHWIVRMVLAISLISQSQKVSDDFYWLAVSHVAEALKYAEPILRPGSLQSIQAILLLVEYARYDPRHFDDWTLIGAVCRAMVDLGLHQDPSRESSVPRAQLRERRVVYHCIYALDRSTSIAHGLALSFSDSSTNVKYPRSDGKTRHISSPEMQIWAQPHEALYHVYKIRQIQSEIYSETNQSGRIPWQRPYEKIWPWWHRINDCYTSFPSNIVASFHSKLLQELELLSAYIFLLAPSARVPLLCELAQSLLFEYSIQYATNMSRALDDSIARPWLHAVDAIRAGKIGAIFIEVLSTYPDRLLSGTLPNLDDQLTPQSLTPPPYPYPHRSNNADRAVVFIQTIGEILNKFGTRFGDTKWFETFELQSRPMLDDLNTRRLSYSSIQSNGSNYSTGTATAM